MTDPQEKRKIIGKTFIDVFKAGGKDSIPARNFWAQGMLYPDVIESGHGHAGTAHEHQIAPQRRRFARGVGV